MHFINNYRKLLSFALLVFLVFPSMTFAEKGNEEKRILFISSYSYSWLPTVFQIKGLQESLEGNDYVINYEFMDQKNTVYSGIYEEFYQYLKFKLRSRTSYDGIMIGDDAALEFAMAYKDELFPHTPIVFEGVDQLERATLAGGDPYITGIVERVDFIANIELAKSLYPNASQLVFIYDEKETGIGPTKQMKEMKDFFIDYDIEYVNMSAYSDEVLIDKLEKYDENSLVFGISIGEQKDNIIHTEEERFKMIAEHTKVPIFSITNAGIGSGLLGGYVINHKQSGFLAGEMMKSILLDNHFPPVVFDTPATYYFDHDTIQAHQIPLSKLPKDATIINVPETFLRKYANWIVIILSISLFLATVAYVLRRRANLRLQHTYDQLVITESELKAQYEHNQAYTEALIEQEAQIRYQAEYDDLTNLPNRRMALKQLDWLINEKEVFTIILMDLDDFKEINDTFGHACGDKVIHSIATRLSTKLPEEIYIARFGGDEFLLIVNQLITDEDQEIMKKIQSVFHAPIVCDSMECHLRMSMGVVHASCDIHASTEMISNADIALFEAKKIGGNSPVFYDIHMRRRLARVKSIQDLLEEACEMDDFKLLFQPQINVSTEKICGYEALVRLKKVAISPAEFIQVAETSDLILKIGRIVTKKAIEQLVAWRARGVQLHPIAINFSTKQIRDQGYVQYLQTLLLEHDITPDLIEIEFTESIFIDNDEQAIKLFEDFKALGIRMALDDFGTGYSSIRYLTYIPVDKIKLDKSFVDLYLREGNGALIENIIRLSHSLGLKITVEGVEKKCQYEHLKQLGCDYVQGYYFSKPIEGKHVQ